MKQRNVTFFIFTKVKIKGLPYEISDKFNIKLHLKILHHYYNIVNWMYANYINTTNRYDEKTPHLWTLQMFGSGCPQGLTFGATDSVPLHCTFPIHCDPPVPSDQICPRRPPGPLTPRSRAAPGHRRTPPESGGPLWLYRRGRGSHCLL